MTGQKIAGPKKAPHSGAKIIRTSPGLSKLALKEMQFRDIIHKSARTMTLYQRNHDLVFLNAIRNPDRCKMLRIAEEVCDCLAWGQYKISQTALDSVAQKLQMKRKTFRLAVTLDGSHFNRQDMQRWLAREMKNRGVRLSEDSQNILWLFLIDEKFYIATQDVAFLNAPYRNKRSAEREGALPVTIAAAIVFAAHPQKGETVLDPTCGSGTLLAETFAAQEGIGHLTGIDLDKAAITIAKKNTGHMPKVSLVNGDATENGLPAESIDLFLANLPFGKQFGEKTDNPVLYRGLLSEMARLGRGAWRAVLLTSDTEALEAAVKENRGLEMNSPFTVKTRGETAKAYILKPAGKEA